MVGDCSYQLPNITVKVMKLFSQINVSEDIVLGEEKEYCYCAVLSDEQGRAIDGMYAIAFCFRPSILETFPLFYRPGKSSIFSWKKSWSCWCSFCGDPVHHFYWVCHCSYHLLASSQGCWWVHLHISIILQYLKTKINVGYIDLSISHILYYLSLFNHFESKPLQIVLLYKYIHSFHRRVT